jgi:hypothetical protein
MEKKNAAFNFSSMIQARIKRSLTRTFLPASSTLPYDLVELQHLENDTFWVSQQDWSC